MYYSIILSDQLLAFIYLNCQTPPKHLESMLKVYLKTKSDSTMSMHNQDQITLFS